MKILLQLLYLYLVNKNQELHNDNHSFEYQNT